MNQQERNYPKGTKLRNPMDTCEPFKVMAYADGYYMLRRPRAMPVVFSKTEVEKHLKLYNQT